jgi:hypothetical protein
MSLNCLNCATPIAHNYCPNCGQRSSTHRYSIQHFLSHDLIHGVWHVDKGILFTLSALFTRPGNSVREFIQGKRVPYFSFITLILLLLTLSGLIAPYTHGKVSDMVPQQSRQMTSDFERIVSSYPKLTLIVTIPIYSLFTFLWFRKARLNFSEHLVINSNRIIAELVLGLLISLISVFYTNKTGLTFLYLIIASLFSLVYSIWFYYQFFSWYGYSKKGVFARAVLVPLSYMFLTAVAGFVFAILKTKS